MASQPRVLHIAAAIAITRERRDHHHYHAPTPSTLRAITGPTRSSKRADLPLNCHMGNTAADAPVAPSLSAKMRHFAASLWTAREVRGSVAKMAVGQTLFMIQFIV